MKSRGPVGVLSPRDRRFGRSGAHSRRNIRTPAVVGCDTAARPRGSPLRADRNAWFREIALHSTRFSGGGTLFEFDPQFREGAVRIVRETGKPIAQIARDLGVHPGTLGNWVAKDRAQHEGTQGLSTGDVAELKRLRAENAQLRMERDVLKRSVVLWVNEATK